MKTKKDIFIIVSCLLVNALFFILLPIMGDVGINLIGESGYNSIIYFILLPIIGLISGILIGSHLGIFTQVYTILFVALAIYIHNLSGSDMNMKYVIANSIIASFLGGGFGVHLKTMKYANSYDEVYE